jgi:hypothetical protein
MIIFVLVIFVIGGGGSLLKFNKTGICVGGAMTETPPRALAAPELIARDQSPVTYILLRALAPSLGTY